MTVVRTRSTSGPQRGRGGHGFLSLRPGTGTPARTAPGQQVGRRRLHLPGVPGSPSPPSPHRVRQGAAGTALLRPPCRASSRGHSSRTTTITSRTGTRRATRSLPRRPSAGDCALLWWWTLVSGRSSGKGLRRDQGRGRGRAPRARAGTGTGTRLGPATDGLRCWAAPCLRLAVWRTGAAPAATGRGTGTEIGTGSGSGSATGTETGSGTERGTGTGNGTGIERGSERGTGTCGDGAGMAPGAAAQRDGIWVLTVAGAAPAGCRGPGRGPGRPGQGRGGPGASGRLCRQPTC